MSQEPDDELRKDVESAFDVFDYLKLGEVRITVRLPAEVMPNGLVQKFGRVDLIPVEQIRIRDPMDTLPRELERFTGLMRRMLWTP